jgi:hypothetical protein
VIRPRTAVLVLVGITIVFTALLHPSLGYQWSDPAPSADSLALEAEQKLHVRSGACVADGVIKLVGHSEGSSRAHGTYITIDTHTNRIYLRKGEKVLLSALCSTGTGARLVDTKEGRSWVFDTPKGFFHVDSKLDNPWWRKPDWAFIEEGAPVPAGDADERFDPYAMGDYAIGFGNGYFIHGTPLERLIGVSVTHGCVRMRSDDLKKLYDAVGMYTPVIIF